MKARATTIVNLEQRAELLKERIYATLALLAVLLTIDTTHASAGQAAVIVAGTALSLWAASIVASRMSYRIIMQQDHPGEEPFKREFVRHSPLLAAAVFPLFTIFLSFIGLISLLVAVDAAIIGLLLLILGWSLLSARAMRAGALSTLLITAAYLAIGLGVVVLKTLVTH
jgi:hypothetical protein